MNNGFRKINFFRLFRTNRKKITYILSLLTATIIAIFSFLKEIPIKEFFEKYVISYLKPEPISIEKTIQDLYKITSGDINNKRIKIIRNYLISHGYSDRQDIKSDVLYYFYKKELERPIYFDQTSGDLFFGTLCNTPVISIKNQSYNSGGGFFIVGNNIDEPKIFQEGLGIIDIKEKFLKNEHVNCLIKLEYYTTSGTGLLEKSWGFFPVYKKEIYEPLKIPSYHHEAAYWGGFKDSEVFENKIQIFDEKKNLKMNFICEYRKNKNLKFLFTWNKDLKKFIQYSGVALLQDEPLGATCGKYIEKQEDFDWIFPEKIQKSEKW